LVSDNDQSVVQEKTELSPDAQQKLDEENQRKTAELHRAIEKWLQAVEQERNKQEAEDQRKREEEVDQASLSAKSTQSVSSSSSSATEPSPSSSASSFFSVSSLFSSVRNMLGAFGHQLNVLSRDSFRMDAETAIATCAERGKDPTLHELFALPKAMHSRFGLMLLHVWLVYHRFMSSHDPNMPSSHNEAWRKNILGETWEYFRIVMMKEMDIGVLTVNKRARELQSYALGAFVVYDRFYQQLLDADTEEDKNVAAEGLMAAFYRNIYGGKCENKAHLRSLLYYMMYQIEYLSRQNDKAFLYATFRFGPIINVKPDYTEEIDPIKYAERHQTDIAFGFNFERV
jgi:hypothetical protein